MGASSKRWAAAAAGLWLAGCGTAAQPPSTLGQTHGPVIPRIARVINGDLLGITASGSLVLPLTGARAKDVVRYTYSITSPQTLTVLDARGRRLLALENVQAVGAVEFRGAHPPLLLVTSSSNGQWGYPLTAYVWNGNLGRLQAVPFSESASATATYVHGSGGYAPQTGAGAVTSLLGFASMGRSGLTVQQSVPQLNTPFPSNYTLDSRWIYAEPPSAGWWILQHSAFGPDRAPQGQEYPQGALATAEEYLTALQLGLPNLARGLAASAAAGTFARYAPRFALPGIGTPLPAFDESAFNTTAVGLGRPGALTMYAWSGSGLGLRLSVVAAQVRLRRASGRWQVASLQLHRVAVNFPTPAAIVPLLARQPQVRAFVRRHPKAQMQISVGSATQFSAELTYPGAPASFVPPTFSVGALTGAVVYAGY